MLHVLTERLYTGGRTCLRAASTRPAAHLLAHLTAPGLGCRAEEAFSILQEQPELTAQFEQDLRRGGLAVRHADAAVSVVDHWEPGAARPALRSLHFNDTFDLVQSAIALDSDGNPSITNIISLDYNKHVVGLSISLALHQLNTPAGQSLSSPSRCAVLGAGGCVLPMTLAHLRPECTVDAVELSPSVVWAAREWFGAGRLVQDGRLALHAGCALRWLSARPDARFDLLFLDICAAASEGGVMHSGGSAELLAPPRGFLEPASVESMARALGPRGVLAANVLGTPLGTAAATSAIQNVLDGLDREFYIGVMTLDNAAEAEAGGGAARRANSIVFVAAEPVEALHAVCGSALSALLYGDGARECAARGGLFRDLFGQETRREVERWLQSYRQHAA